MVVMKEEKEKEEEEKQDDLKQTSSFPPTARETAVHQTKTSHNEKNVTSLPECMHAEMCVYLRFNLPPQSNTTIHYNLTYSPSAPGLSPS